MMAKSSFLGAVLLGLLVFAAESPARAQTTVAVPGEIAAPDYGSGASAGSLSNGNFNTPESDGRPGVYYFDLGVRAFKKGDYRHASDMYKVAASWAYKPAEYDLGIMYFKGQGLPVDRARGAAWMILAAERGEPPLYVEARDLMVTALTKQQFARTDEIWNELKPTYGDAVALRRAKAQWALARNNETGSHLGGTSGELRVGESAWPGSLASPPPAKGPMVVTASEMLTGGSIDGAVAYHQFQESDNPYSPIFVKNRSGTARVGPLEQIKPANGKSKQTTDKTLPPSSSQQRKPR